MRTRLVITGLFLMTFSPISWSQGNFFNRGTVIIDAGSELLVKGNVILDKPVTGNGYFTVSGNSAQDLGGNQLEFDHLRLNSASIASLHSQALVHLGFDCVSGTLELAQNDLDCSAGMFFSGGNNTSYISTSGPGHIHIQPVPGDTIPVGSAAGFHPVIISPLMSNEDFYIRAFGYLPSNGQYQGSPLTNDVGLLAWEILDQSPAGNNFSVEFLWPDVANSVSFNQRFAVPVKYNGASYVSLNTCGTDVRFMDPNSVSFVMGSGGVFGVGDDQFLSQAPVFTITPSSDTAFCSGDSVVYLAASGSGYQWSDGPVTQANSISQSGSYFVEILNPNGCIYKSDTVDVIVWSLPVAQINPGTDTAICSGDTIFLDIVGGISQVWNTGDTSSQISISNAGTYSATIMDSNGCEAVSGTVSVSILPLPPVPTITRAGNTLQSSSASGYQWYLNGVLIPGAVGQAYPVTQNGNYTVVISNPAGCESSSAGFTVGDLSVNPETFEYSVFPNPTDKFVQVQLGYVPVDGTFSVLDILGRVVQQSVITGSSVILELPSAGTYTIFIFDGSHELFHSKVVKN